MGADAGDRKASDLGLNGVGRPPHIFHNLTKHKGQMAMTVRHRSESKRLGHLPLPSQEHEAFHSPWGGCRTPQGSGR